MGDKTKNLPRGQNFGKPSENPEADTFDTEKVTMFVKRDLLQKLKNFAYWDRYSLTKALTVALTDGLKGKNTKEIEKR